LQHDYVIRGPVQLCQWSDTSWGMLASIAVSVSSIILTLELGRLGDRHGENILFEEGTGGVIHVDFNCLFDKVR
jgi:hypothetical protein